MSSMEASKLLINMPVDATLADSGNPSVYDIKPDRGMKEQPGPNTFVLGGANFDAITGVNPWFPVALLSTLATATLPIVCFSTRAAKTARYTQPI